MTIDIILPGLETDHVRHYTQYKGRAQCASRSFAPSAYVRLESGKDGFVFVDTGRVEKKTADNEGDL